jgi:hypothetical protein
MIESIRVVSSQDAGGVLTLRQEPSCRVWPAKAPVRPVVIVVVLPLFQFHIEEVNVVRDAVAIEKLVELLVIDAMRLFDLPVQMWRPRPDVHMPDVELF